MTGRIKKRIGRSLIFGGCGLFFLLVSVLLLFQAEPVRSRVLRLAVESVERRLPVRLEIGRIAGNLLFSASLTDVRLEGKDGLLFAAERIFIRFSPRLLFERTLCIREARIEKPQVSFIRYGDGGSNFDPLLSPRRPAPEGTGESSGIILRLDRIAVTGGSFDFEDRRNGSERMRFSAVEIDSALSYGRGGDVGAEFERLSFRLDHPSFVPADVNGSASYDSARKRIGFDRLRIETPDSHLILSGSVSFAEGGPGLDITAGAFSLAPREIGRFHPLLREVPEALRGAFTVSGTADAFTHSLTLGLGAASVETRGTIVSAFEDLAMEISGSVSDLDPAVLPRIAGSLPELPGNLNFNFKVKAENLFKTSRRIEADLEIGRSHLAGYHAEKGNLAARFAENMLSIETLGLETDAGRIDLRGNAAGLFLPAGDIAVDLKAALRGIDPARLLKSGTPPGAVNLDLSLKAAFPREAPSASFAAGSGEVSASILPSRLSGAEIRRGTLEASLRKGKIEIKTFQLAVPSGSADLKGTIDATAASASIEANFDLPDVGGAADLLRRLDLLTDSQLPKDISGSLRAVARMKGRWDRPEISGSVQAEAFKYADYSAGRLSFDGAWKKETGVFGLTGLKGADLSFKGEPVTRLSGSAAISPDRLEVDLEGIRAGVGELILAGSLGWSEPDLDLVIERLRFTPEAGHPIPAGFRRLKSEGTVRIRFIPDGVDIIDFPFSADEASGNLKGSISGTGAQNLRIFVRNLEMKRLSSFLPDAAGLRGTSAFDVQISGTREKPVLRADFKIKNGAAFDFPFSDLSFKTVYSGASLSVSGALHRNDRKLLDLAGTVPAALTLHPFSASLLPEELDIRLKADGLALSQLPLPALFGLENAFRLSGRFSGEIAVSGTSGKPVIDAALRIREGSGFGFSFSDFSIRSAYSGETLTVNGVLSRGDRKLLAFDGRVPVSFSFHPFSPAVLPGGVRLDVEASNLKLSELPLPKPSGIDLEGILNGRAVLSGEYSSPEVNGEITLTEGRLKSVSPPLSYENVSARIFISPTEIRIDTFQLAGDKEGKMVLTGSIPLAGLRPGAFNLRLTGEKLSIPFRRGVDARFDPDLTLTGAFERPKLAGSLRVVEGRIDLDRISEQGPSEIRVIRERSPENGRIVLPAGDEEGFFKPFSADVNLIVPNKVWLKGQGLTAEVAGSIRLQKEAERRFILLGSVKTVRGTYLFRNRLFTIERGNVAFIGLEEINPNLDLRATARIANADIIVNITGTARDIRLTLDSDPHMDQTDIVSHIVFGQPAGALNRQQSFEAGKMALGLTGQLAAEELRKVFGDAFHLDTIVIDPGGGDFASGSIAVGKYIAPDVFVTYRHRFRSEDPRQVEIVYRITPKLSIETQLGNEKNSGADLILNFDF